MCASRNSVIAITANVLRVRIPRHELAHPRRIGTCTPRGLVSAVNPSSRQINVLVRPQIFTSLPLWTLVTAISIGTAGWAGWVAATSTSEAATAAKSPVDARQEEILRAAIDRPGDRQLGQIYQSINLRHFGGTLPSMAVVWEPRLEEVGTLAGRSFTLEGMFGRLDHRTIILLHPKLQTDPRALERALCHEMVHAYLFASGDSSTDHGPRFQLVLKRLADEGAFVGVVGSSEERQQLRAWLDAESARLESERADLERLGKEIEQERVEVERALAGVQPSDVDAVEARRDAYNQRAADANGRADRYREAVAEFEKQTQRYNLMVVYPDGLLRANR